jgi:hypothetical protein
VPLLTYISIRHLQPHTSCGPNRNISKTNILRTRCTSSTEGSGLEHPDGNLINCYADVAGIDGLCTALIKRLLVEGSGQWAVGKER